MIRFGPSGKSDRFTAEGYKRTEEMPKWLSAQGLLALEYPCGHGVTLKEETARRIGAQAAQYHIALSIHAPYYINLASPEQERQEKSLRYIRQASEVAQWMGADRVVIHPGSCRVEGRVVALKRAISLFAMAGEIAEEYNVYLCPETMGKKNELGSVEDVIALCGLHDRFLPTIDFAHLHAISGGGLSMRDDYRAVLDPFIKNLGMDKMRAFHMHFSHIEFGGSGEKRHKNFKDEGFGPDFTPLAEVLLEYDLTPRVICEASGDQADDALSMLRIYNEIMGNQVS